MEIIPTPPEQPTKLKRNLIEGSNLIRAAPNENTGRPSQFYKLILLEILTIGAALALGYTLRFFLLDQMAWYYPLVALAVFILFSNFLLFVTKSLERRIIVVFLETIALFACFYTVSLLPLGGSAVAVFAFLAWGEVAGFHELQNSIELRFLKIATPQVVKLTTAVIILIILISFAQGYLFFSQEKFNVVFKSTVGPIQQFYPEINFTGTFHDFAESLARFGLDKNPDYRALNSADKEKVLANATSQTTSNLTQNFNTPISPDKPVAAAFYEFFIAFLGRLYTNFGNSFLFVWGFIVFFLLEGIGAFFRASILAIGYFAYELALAMNIFTIFGESRMRETIDFS